MRYCEDCGSAYETSPLHDVTLPDDQWLMIHPGGKKGILCGVCIMKRALKLPGVVVIRMCLELVQGPAFICEWRKAQDA